MVYLDKDKYTFSGLSTDDKPIHTNTPDLSTFWEFDTSTAYIYSKNNINPATGDGWWAV